METTTNGIGFYRVEANNIKKIDPNDHGVGKWASAILDDQSPFYNCANSLFFWTKDIFNPQLKLSEKR